MKLNLSIPKAKNVCNIEKVAIFGSADIDEKHPLYFEVFSLARQLAYRGKVVVDGGGPGVMLAATLGAKAGGGKTIAVTFSPKEMPEFEGRDVANEVDLEIRTTNYVERMFGLLDLSDAYICVQGGTGTLSEWATAWLMAHLQYGRHKPIILYGAFWHQLMKIIDEHFFIGQKEHEVYRIAETPEEVFLILEEFEQDLADRCNLPDKSSRKSNDD